MTDEAHCTCGHSKDHHGRRLGRCQADHCRCPRYYADDEEQEQEALDRVMRDGIKKTDELEREIRALNDKLVAGGNLYAIEFERASKFGLALMMIREGCADPRRVAREALQEYPPK